MGHIHGHHPTQETVHWGNSHSVSCACLDRFLLTTPENDEENPSTAGREGLRVSLQCDTSGDHASSAHTTPSASNTRASTEETASAGRHRGRPRGAKNRSWQGDPTRYGLRSTTTMDDDV
jgi:hypothetical protein